MEVFDFWGKFGLIRFWLFECWHEINMKNYLVWVFDKFLINFGFWV